MSTTTLMTLGEFEQLPEAPGKHELVDGQPVTMPPPDKLRSKLAKRMYRLLSDTLNESQVWGDHTGYRIGSGWIEPDASISWHDQHEDEKYLVGSPMVAVEILSPGEEIERKLTLYFAEGALEVWVIDPKHETMTVYVRRGDEVLRIPVVDQHTSDAAGVTVVLNQLFRL